MLPANGMEREWTSLFPIAFSADLREANVASLRFARAAFGVPLVFHSEAAIRARAFREFLVSVL
jgi:hypothetical protein